MPYSSSLLTCLQHAEWWTLRRCLQPARPRQARSPTSRVPTTPDLSPSLTTPSTCRPPRPSGLASSGCEACQLLLCISRRTSRDSIVFSLCAASAGLQLHAAVHCMLSMLHLARAGPTPNVPACTLPASGGCASNTAQLKVTATSMRCDDPELAELYLSSQQHDESLHNSMN